MTKVYLVCAQGCESNGTIDIMSKKYVKFVFTNYKLAKNCADYLNENWSLAFKRNADFKKDCIYFYYVETRTISKIDFSKIPF